MNLLVVSHKKSWPNPDAPGQFITTGGFPLQMAALSELFDSTTLLIPRFNTPIPGGTLPLTGKNLAVSSLTEIPPAGPRRKAAVLLAWRRIWQAVASADIVHLPIPGDVGLIGLLVTLAQRKPCFVRYCGPWGQWNSPIERGQQRLLTRVADNQSRFVFATGGSEMPPEPRNLAIRWIFSTTYTDAEWRHIEPARPWRRGEPLRLITAGRLTPVKNTEAILGALPHIREHVPHVRLDILGDGPRRPELASLAAELGIDDLVTFHGFVDHEEVVARLCRAHLFLLPSHFEGFPKALIEALACGLPAVATAVSVIPDLIGDRCGVLVDVPSAEKVAAAVLDLIADDNRLAQQARAARAVSRTYTLERWAAAFSESLTPSLGPLQSAEASHHVAARP